MIHTAIVEAAAAATTVESAAAPPTHVVAHGATTTTTPVVVVPTGCMPWEGPLDFNFLALDRMIFTVPHDLIHGGRRVKGHEAVATRVLRCMINHDVGLRDGAKPCEIRAQIRFLNLRRETPHKNLADRLTIGVSDIAAASTLTAATSVGRLPGTRDRQLCLHQFSFDLMLLFHHALGNVSVLEGDEAKASAIASDLVAHDHHVSKRAVGAKVRLEIILRHVGAQPTNEDFAFSEPHCALVSESAFRSHAFFYLQAIKKKKTFDFPAFFRCMLLLHVCMYTLIHVCVIRV